VCIDAAILHVDLDAFYASVEQLDDEALRGRPVVVGGLGGRGVVAAASYEARTFGVHSAMPMARARRACPSAAFVSPRFERYAAKSREVMAIFESVTPLVEQLSIDEAFLDVRGARRLLGTGTDIARIVRSRVLDEAGLVVSVGVATTKFLAKLASDLSKPDGLLAVEPGTERAFLAPLPVSRRCADWNGCRYGRSVMSRRCRRRRSPPRSDRRWVNDFGPWPATTTRGPWYPNARSSRSVRKKPSPSTSPPAPPANARSCVSSTG
jgi:hypothetical protein